MLGREEKECRIQSRHGVLFLSAQHLLPHQCPFNCLPRAPVPSDPLLSPTPRGAAKFRGQEEEVRMENGGSSLINLPGNSFWPLGLRGPCPLDICFMLDGTGWTWAITHRRGAFEFGSAVGEVVGGCLTAHWLQLEREKGNCDFL